VVWIDRHRFFDLSTRECQKLLSELLSPEAGFQRNAGEFFDLLRIVRRPKDDIHTAGDDHEQIVEVVGDAAGKLSHGIEPLRMGEVFPRSGKLQVALLRYFESFREARVKPVQL
jgi:hypothetical protein